MKNQIRINKLLTLLLTLCVLFVCMTGTAMATDATYVAKVGDTSYTDFDAALTAWTDGTALPLLDNVSYNDCIDLSDPNATRTFNGGNYTGTATGSFAIGKAIPEVTAPKAPQGLTYTGVEQQLVISGGTTAGTLLYSTEENGTYSADIPMATNAGNYTVWYYLQGGGNYDDTEKASISVTIKPIVLTVNANDAAYTKTYDGTMSAAVGLKPGPGLNGDLLPGADIQLTTDPLPDYPAPDAGSYDVKIGVELWGEDARNYQLNTDKVTVKAIIEPKPLTAVAEACTRAYDGTRNVELTGGSLVGLIGSDQVAIDLSGAQAVMADANAGENKAVTVTGVKLSGDAAGNYELTAQPAGLTVTISKAQATPVSRTIQVINDLAANHTFDLASLLPALDGGKSYGNVSYTLESVNFTASDYYTGGASISGSTLTLPINKVESSEEKQIGTVTVTIHSQNFEDSTLTLTVNSANKQNVDGGINVSVSDIAYGADPAPNYSFAGTSVGASGWVVLYSGDNGASWSSLDALKAGGYLPVGSYIVKASYEDDAQVGEKNAAFTVARKQLSWDISGVSFAPQAYVPGKTAVESVTGAPALSGVLPGEDVSYTASIVYQFADDKPGADKTVTATLSSLELTGADAASYLAPDASFVLTGTITSPATEGGENADIVEEGGTTLIVTKDTQLPDSAGYYGEKAKTALEARFGTADTVAKIEVHMQEAGEAAIASMGSVTTSTAKMEVLEISLKYWDDQSGKWIKITEDTLNLVPKRGIEVVIPYSLFGFNDVDNLSQYRFMVQHMITLPMDNVYKIGDIEDLSGEIVAMPEGLKIHVEHGFSPFVVGYARVVDQAAIGALPKTGDNSQLGAWLAILSLCGAGMLALRSRKRRTE